VHKLGSAFFLCLQGIREKREDENPMLWEWIRRAKAVGEKWEKVYQSMVFIQKADQVACV
jgi:hypothetical protein